MLNIFPKLFMSKQSYPNWFYLFTIFLLFTMHFQNLQPLKLTFKLEQKLFRNYFQSLQPVRKVADLRTRNPTNFSLYFSDFSMIYYDFPSSQQDFKKNLTK